MTPNKSIEDRLDAVLSKFRSDAINPELSPTESLDPAKQQILSLIAETEKAYGGCHNCYGKGYATASTWASGKGHKWRTSGPMQFCKCERGKQLSSLIAEVIGEDERPELQPDFDKLGYTEQHNLINQYLGKKELRAEQRKRAGIKATGAKDE